MISSFMLLKYNNYYNRRLKREYSVSKYASYMVGEASAPVNFIPLNGVSTRQIVNNEEAMEADYFVVMNEAKTEVLSRWFIINCSRLRKGQYELDLKRDVVADYHDDVIISQFMIEKGFVRDEDPLIFNDEEQIYNSIKTSETLLKDESNSAWIVGYVPRKMSMTEEGETFTTRILDITVTNDEADLEYDNIEDFPYYKYMNQLTFVEPTVLVKFFTKYKLAGGGQIKYSEVDYNIRTTKYASENVSGSYWKDDLMEISNSSPSYSTALMMDRITPLIDDYINMEDIIAAARVIELPIEAYTDIKNNYNGKRIKCDDGSIYMVSLEPYEGDISTLAVLEEAKEEFSKFPSSDGWTCKEENMKLEDIRVSGAIKVALKLTTLSTMLHVEFPGDDIRVKVNDAPYDIFCIPFNETVKLKLPDSSLKIKEWTGLAVAMGLANVIGVSNLIDVQILPYCPARYLFELGGYIDVSANSGNMFDITDDKGEVVNKMIWVNTSETSFNIYERIEIYNHKESNCLDSYRLCSPNYNGIFEFSAAKNNGVRYYDVDMTVKPYTPYVHIAPHFEGLYGADFNDARGLILSGDFSLPSTSDAWTEYELQNKNYQQSFDRSIESMELSKKYSMISQGASSVLSAIGTGTATGIHAGPYAGAAIGAGSLVAGAVDTYMQYQLATDAIDQAKDQFNYQLGNIQALPQTLTKVSVLNGNNKLFPFIEYYTCTEKEKEIFRDKIKFNGMTVMATGLIYDYVEDDEETYVRANLLRFNGDSANFIVTASIAEEFKKGLYIRKDDADVNTR